MSRIRTLKPEMAKHEGLYDLELETGLPIRFAWAMLPTACDREGRFKWRPRELKADILPHDPIEFSRVLDAWLTRGFVVRYRVGNEWFGWVPTFRKHQVINTRESASSLPAFDDAAEVIDHRNQPHADASGTRESRVDNASSTRAVHARGEGKGREQGREGKEDQSSLRSDSSSTDVADPASAKVEKPEAGKPSLTLVPSEGGKSSKAERLKEVTRDAVEAFNSKLGKPVGLLPSVSLKVGLHNRSKQVGRCVRVAREICAELFASQVITREFWDAYFEACALDEFKSGRRSGGPGHENWLPSFEYLTREKTMLEVFDKATSQDAA